jgi:hypothetical protein
MSEGHLLVWNLEFGIWNFPDKPGPFWLRLVRVNTYHIITLDFKKEEVHIWARRWIPERGCWGVYDNDINNTYPFPGRGSIPC